MSTFDESTGQPAPRPVPDEQVAALAMIRAEEHLKAIRSYVGWLLALALIGVLAGVVVAYQVAEESSTNGF